MKNLLTTLGGLYVVVSVFLMTDLNPLLYWDWYRSTLNALFEPMFKAHPGLLLIWIFSVVIVAGILSTVNEGDEEERRYRKKHGLCLNCGYNLAATPNCCCPECGTKPINRLASG